MVLVHRDLNSLYAWLFDCINCIKMFDNGWETESPREGTGERRIEGGREVAPGPGPQDSWQIAATVVLRFQDPLYRTRLASILGCPAIKTPCRGCS